MAYIEVPNPSKKKNNPVIIPASKEKADIRLINLSSLGIMPTFIEYTFEKMEKLVSCTPNIANIAPYKSVFTSNITCPIENGLRVNTDIKISPTIKKNRPG